MASINSQLRAITNDGTVRDYAHGSRTFVDNNYELHPKFSNLFHVVFNFMPEAATLFNTVEKLEIPILVKSIDLPSFTIDAQTHNQYNRQVTTHHKMVYNPITATFHDDAKDLIREMWNKYYIFYNADSTYDLDSNSYTPYDKYGERVQQQWGLQRGNKRFFKNIKIYSMHNHKFTEHTLINPIITAFNHDTHAYANGGLMQHTVQFSYETVKYATGYVNNVTPTGFGDLHYDTERSDLDPNTQNQAFINGESKDVAGQRERDMFRGNVIGTIQDAEVIYNQTQPITSGNVIQDTLSIFANNLLTGAKPTSNILVPVTGLFKQAAGTKVENFTDNLIDTGINFASNLLSSQGKNVGTTSFTTSPKITNPEPVRQNTRVSGTRNQRLSQLQTRLNDPNIGPQEAEAIKERIRLENL